MDNSEPTLAQRIDDLAADFQSLDKRERLELLLEFANRLPPLPESYSAQKETHRVHECMTPVFLFVELPEGRVQIHAEVAEEAPTVKGFVSLLAETFRGSPPAEVLQVRPDLLHRLGLIEALGMQRMRGLNAVFNRIRGEVARQVGAN
ncbi:MAG: SufE family protein [Planctomycetia bacterium]|nr:SufE family protein [Planctomycetia bacterium]